MTTDEKKDSSGPAFPNNPIHFADAPSLKGLTKREWFAGMAMQGILSNPHESLPDQPFGVSNLAVKHADALLKELKENPNE